MSADERLARHADLYRQRHEVYGENFRVVGAILKALFPNGVKLETEDDHNRWHLFVLEIVKITRYANNWEKGGHEDSQDDLSVYAAMLAEIEAEIREQPGKEANQKSSKPARHIEAHPDRGLVIVKNEMGRQIAIFSEAANGSMDNAYDAAVKYVNRGM